MMKDKDVRHSISKTLPLADRVYTVEPLDNPRAMPSDELAALAREYCPDVRSRGKDLDVAFAEAYDSLSPEDTLLVCGSLYVASDLRRTARSFFESRQISHSPHL